MGSTTRTLQHSVYIAIVVVLLALSGIFASFEERAVVESGVRLSTVLLVAIFIGTGYYAAGRAGTPGGTQITLAALAAGLLGSAVVGAALAALVALQTNVDLSFVFPNLAPLLGGPVTFGQPEPGGAVAALMVASLTFGIVGALLQLVPPRLRTVLIISAVGTVIVGLLEAQIQNIMALPDALAVALAFALGYAAAVAAQRRTMPVTVRLLIGGAAGAVAGLVLALIANGGGVADGGILRGTNSVPLILSAFSGAALVPFPLIFGVVGAVGALATASSRGVHNGLILVVVALVLVGMLNAQNAMTVAATVMTFALLAATLWALPLVSEDVGTHFSTLPRPRRRALNTLGFIAFLLILVVAPVFMGQYITDVLNLVGLYVIMGIGLNVVVGYAGLLDLGYVAFFAIGAYAVGLLTTPSLLTCGGVAPSEITPETVGTICTGILSFWQAWIVASLLSALGGVMLGIPVLRLRGDYLAIVTLGFGEIIRIIVKFDDFKPLFGAAQGIANIPRPVVDLSALNPAWRFTLDGSTGIYYLILFGVLLTAFVATRLVTSRLGRAWRAMRADEDVAQMMGINLVQTKLLAFAIGAGCAGLGGAIAGTRLYGAYPDSFTLLVSINVLSLIIIGGLGSIPGVIVGALVLIGLPEVLRELEDFRLLAFGVLLVAMMLLKPSGFIPPPVRKLSEDAAERAVS